MKFSRGFVATWLLVVFCASTLSAQDSSSPIAIWAKVSGPRLWQALPQLGHVSALEHARTRWHSADREHRFVDYKRYGRAQHENKRQTSECDWWRSLAHRV